VAKWRKATGRNRPAVMLLVAPGSMYLMTAKALGLDVPPLLLARADEVIE